ncbi:hypothetical protein nbrc107696_38230 [Gordonia spumicola]|uniref:Uncharacterized protein n=1 Tax=Gordonia spumicola TaxID=589161 RepID=A0A7I9VDJ2_9ACTN|nr:hypothetical protein [Gordonia spumicola]GEE03377.1 hypothetical protein nbrc107696_38230 [Gordonia spumicola]
MNMQASDGGGLRARLGRLLGGKRSSGRVPAVDDQDLVVVVTSLDDTSASSTVLDDAGFSSSGPVVLRHHVELPPESVEAAVASAGLEGYVRTTVDGLRAADGFVLIGLARVQVVDARTVSQERSRTASLASRNGGRTVGWALLDVPSEPVDRVER